jgi:hypothetical protein
MVGCQESSWKTGEVSSGSFGALGIGKCGYAPQGEQPDCLPATGQSAQYTGIESGKLKFLWCVYDARWLDPGCGLTDFTEITDNSLSTHGCCAALCSSTQTQGECTGGGNTYTGSGCRCYNPGCQQEDEACSDNGQCCSNYCNPANVCGFATPIMLNLRNNSTNYGLTSPADGVRFDMNGSGDAEPKAWTAPDSEVAFLVLDRNQNGRVDSGAELFGNATPMRNGQLASNGFEALIDLDGGRDQSDGRIDASDPVYGRLLLWVDRNHNGVSEPSELQTLRHAGVTTILTRYHESRHVDVHGNAYRYTGQALVLRSGRKCHDASWMSFSKWERASGG